MEKKHIMLLLLIIYFFAMIVGGMLPSIAKTNIVKKHDKLLHFLEFFVFAILLYFTLYFYNFSYKTLILIFLAPTIAILTELIQIPISGRSFGIIDIYYDLMGISLGIIISVITQWTFFKQSS